MTAAAPPRYRRALRALGIDRAIGYTVLLQSFALVSRPLLLALMVAFLSKEEQGYQYTILALIGLKSLFEMGVGIALIHFVGRESDRVDLSPDRGASGDPVALSRVASLFQKVMVSYGLVAAAFAAVLLPAGWAFLAASPDSAAVSWKTAWVVAVATTAVGFPADGAANVLIGGGQFVAVLRIRMISTVAQAMIYGGLLAAGAGLLAAAAGNLGAVVLQTAFTAGRYRRVFRDLWAVVPGAAGVRWWREVFPFQWRVAISWLSNYFLAQALVPVAFRFFGDVASGRLGLTFAVSAILQAFSYGWVATKLPRYAALLGTTGRTALRAAFLRDLRYAVAVYLLGGICAVVGLIVVTFGRPDLAQRVLPVDSLVCVLGMGLCAMVVECLGSCLNAFHRDPLMPIRLAAAVVTTAAAVAAGAAGELRVMLAAAFAVSAVSATASAVVWRRCMRTWDGPAAGSS